MTSSLIVIFFLLNHGPLLWRRGYRKAKLRVHGRKKKRPAKRLRRGQTADDEDDGSDGEGGADAGPGSGKNENAGGGEGNSQKKKKAQNAGDRRQYQQHQPALTLEQSVTGRRPRGEELRRADPRLVLFTVLSLLRNMEFMYHLACAYAARRGQ